MMYYSVFNTANKPIYVQQTNTYVSPAIESMPDLSAASAGKLLHLLQVMSVQAEALTCCFKSLTRLLLKPT